MISLELILNDWSDYDDKKCKEKNDCSVFSCEQKWEREYLKNKILEQYPTIKGNDIIHTIRFCGLAMPAPRPRKIFISFVVERLKKKLRGDFHSLFDHEGLNRL